MPKQINTTHTLLERKLVLYRRENSGTWQCRYKVDGKWQRTTTKETELKKAQDVAQELLIAAEIRKRDNLPVVTRRFRDIAKLAIKRMEDELAAGNGKAIYSDYIAAINNYFIPLLGKRLITNIDHTALEEVDAERIELMGKAPAQSTLLNHNAALNRVFEEAVIRGFLTDANRIKLTAKGKTGNRRAAFTLKETKALLANFDGWIEAGRNEHSKEMRMLMRDYTEMLLDTGARPGKELLDLKWKQIEIAIAPEYKLLDKVDEEGEQEGALKINYSVELTVSGKTGTRQTMGMAATARVLKSIAQRNYNLATPLTNPIENVQKKHGNEYVFRLKDKVGGKQVDPSSSFQKMFESYLEDHNLLVDAATEQKRVFYSLRHTYATLRLTHDKIPVHTLATQMGTSVLMIEKHYSHLKVKEAETQLRAENTQALLAASVLDEMYTSKKRVKNA